MFRGNPPIDATATTELKALPGTIPQRVITDADLAGLSPTQTLVASETFEVQQAKHTGSHRRQPAKLLTWRQTGGAAAALAAMVFVGALASSPAHNAPMTVRQAAPDAAVVVHPHKAKPKATRPVARSAEPVALRSERPVAKPAPTHTVVVTVTPTPKQTHAPAPKPSATPTPSVTPTPSPDGNSPESIVTDAPSTAPDTEQTTGTEVPDGDA